MSERAANTPDEVRVAFADLRDLIAATDGADIVPTVLSSEPFNARNTPIYTELVAQAGDQNLRTYVSFKARQAAWDLRWSE